MSAPGDIVDDAAADDPVVRMPRAMASSPPAPSGAGARTVATVAAVGALVGASLGGVGIGIVWAMRQPLAPRPAAARPVVVEETVVDAGPPEVYALAVDAGPRPERTAAGEEGDVEVQRQEVGPGGLAATLRAMGVPPREVPRVVNALRVYVNMRSLMPTDRVTVLREPETHETRRVEFQRGPTVAFAVTRGGRGRWRAERVEVLVTASRVEAGFRVRGGIEASVRAAGLDLSIVTGLAECFTAMDLPPTLAEGDLVRLVVDEERLNREFSRYGRVLAVDYRGAHGDRRAYWLSLGPRRGDWFDPEGNSWERGPLRSPLPGAAVTARFDPARVHPTLHRLMPHNGVDYAAPEGTPVYAAADGLVTWANESGTSGNLVRIRHAALGVESGYAHLSVIEEGLRPGQRVRLRQRVGLVGSTGRSTGPHLHFSVQRGGAFIDPLSMHGDRRSVPPALRGRFEADRADLDAALDRVAVEGVTLAPPDAGAAPSRPLPHAPPPGVITPGPPPAEMEGDEPTGPLAD